MNTWKNNYQNKLTVVVNIIRMCNIIAAMERAAARGAVPIDSFFLFFAGVASTMASQDAWKMARMPTNLGHFITRMAFCIEIKHVLRRGSFFVCKFTALYLADGILHIRGLVLTHCYSVDVYAHPALFLRSIGLPYLWLRLETVSLAEPSGSISLCLAVGSTLIILSFSSV